MAGKVYLRSTESHLRDSNPGLQLYEAVASDSQKAA
jgi:hypothetical protein